MKLIVINKEYTKLLVATFITRFGDSIDTIAFSWLVYVMTGSRVLMGTIFIVSVIPNLMILPFGGVLADTLDKKVITVIGDLLRGVAVACLALLFAFHLLEVWHIFVFTILNSVFESFANPARGSMMQSLIDSKDYVTGTSYRNSVSQIGTLVGLAMAGVLIGVIGIGGTILMDAVTFFLSAIIIAIMHFKDTREQTLNIKTIKEVFKPIVEGFHYMKSTNILFTIVLLASFINFSFVPYNVLRPVYVDDVLQIGAEGLSYLGIAIFAGMIVGGFMMGKLGKNANPITAITIGLIMMGSMYVCLGAVEYFHFSFVVQIIYTITVTFLLGFFTPIIQAPISALVMKKTSPEMIGRLSSIMGVFALCAMPLGGALVSIIGDSITVTLLFIIMGLSCVVVSSMFWMKHHTVSIT